jgi:hypothetical protein
LDKVERRLTSEVDKLTAREKTAEKGTEMTEEEPFRSGNRISTPHLNDGYLDAGYGCRTSSMPATAYDYTAIGQA